jgi:hypothetical protein
MNLEFSFRGISLARGDDHEARDETAEWRWIDEAVNASAELRRRRECISIVADAAATEVRFVLHWQEHHSDIEAAEPVIRLAELLAEFGSEHHVAWEVAHQHDGPLARIESPACLAALAEEVATAIRVARALDDLIVDDEIVETETGFPAVAAQLCRDADWTLAVVHEESFQRFPEWD